MQKLSDKMRKNNLDSLLDEAYDEALQDENFKEFVCKLKVKREILKKANYQNCNLNNSH